MSQKCAEEKTPKREKKLPNDQDQTGVLNESDFFLSGPDVSKEKETVENPKGELMDFFLSK